MKAYYFGYGSLSLVFHASRQYSRLEDIIHDVNKLYRNNISYAQIVVMEKGTIVAVLQGGVWTDLTKAEAPARLGA